MSPKVLVKLFQSKDSLSGELDKKKLCKSLNINVFAKKMRCGNVHQDNISKHRKWFRSAKMIPLSRLSIILFCKKKELRGMGSKIATRTIYHLEIDNFVSNHLYNKVLMEFYHASGGFIINRRVEIFEH